jgi:hypothetical protein
MIVRMRAALREGPVTEDVLMQETFAPFRTLDIALSEMLLWLQQVRSLCGSIRLGSFNKNSGSVPE